MRPAEYRNLLVDVRQRGIQVPIEVQGNTVLDGRHRLRAVLELGLPVVPVVQVAPADALDHLVRAAVSRRHLADDQRAVIAALFAQQNAKRAGRPSREMRAHGGPHSKDRHPARTEAATRLGVTPAKVKKAIALLARSPELAKQVHAGEMKLATALRTVQRREQLVAIERARLPEGVFRTLVADPPWRYEDAGCSGAAERHYPTMSLEEICALRIRERTADAAHCYLWITNPMLAEGLKVLAAWGFEPKTMITWKKPRLGLGRYFRSQTEHVLFGVRGKLPLKAQDIPNVFEAPQGRHSEKPEEFFALVERASPGPYLELFARRVRPGPDWTCWGAEVEAPPNRGPAGIIGTTPEVKPEGADS